LRKGGGRGGGSEGKKERKNGPSKRGGGGKKKKQENKWEKEAWSVEVKTHHKKTRTSYLERKGERASHNLIRKGKRNHRFSIWEEEKRNHEWWKTEPGGES